MKKILFLFLLTVTLYPQSSTMLLLMDDGVPIYKGITITANTANYVIDDGGAPKFFQVAGVAGKKFKVDWGDGTTSEITFTGATTDQRIAKTYASAGTYPLKITGWENVTRLRLQNWNAGAMNLQDLPTGLTYLYLDNLGTNLTGSISSLPTGLTYLKLVSSNFTGSFSHLVNINTLWIEAISGNVTGTISGLNNCTTLWLSDTEITGEGIIGNLSASANYILLSTKGSYDLTTSLKAFNSATIMITPQAGQGYTTAEIDAFLIAYDAVAGTGTKTIDLRGSNQPRSSASDAAVTSLQSKGRTILTNP